MKPLLSDSLRALIDATPEAQREHVRAIALAAFIEGTMAANADLLELSGRLGNRAELARCEMVKP